MSTLARLSVLGLLALWSLSADASDNPFSKRPDAHGPIGVMGEHTHHAGEVMFSYRWSRMLMDGNRSRTHNDAVADILGPPPGRFPVVPTEMQMDMHMLGVMVAPHDRVTLMGMLPLVELDMLHVTAAGARFRTHTSHLGDLRASALIGVIQGERHSLHLNAGVSFPTGDIRHRGNTPAGRTRLPYPMQTGSGTWDLLPGATYLGHTDRLSWGLQAITTLRTGRNSLGYRLGNRLDGSAWVAHPLADWISLSVRAAATAWGNVVGRDDAQNPALVPTADPNRRGGRRVDLLGGVNLSLPLGPLGSQRLALEAGAPVYQWLDGPQLGTDWRVTLGWQKAFTGVLPGIGGD